MKHNTTKKISPHLATKAKLERDWAEWKAKFIAGELVYVFPRAEQLLFQRGY